MNKEFVIYEQALALKELGFDEPCLGAHGPWGFMPPNDVNSLSDDVRKEDLDNQWSDEDSVCLAPTYSQAFRWFREKHGIHSIIEITIDDKWYFSIFNLNEKRNSEIETIEFYFDKYKEAELACLKKLIEIVKS